MNTAPYCNLRPYVKCSVCGKSVAKGTECWCGDGRGFGAHSDFNFIGGSRQSDFYIRPPHLDYDESPSWENGVKILEG